MTSHELAKALLRLPDLAVACFGEPTTTVEIESITMQPPDMWCSDELQKYPKIIILT